MSYFSNSMRYLVTSILSPASRRFTPLIDYIESLLAPLQDYYNDFAVLDADQRVRARFSGQIIVMRAAVEYITGKTGVLITVQRSFQEQGALYLESETSEDQQYFSLQSESEPYYFILEGETLQDFSFTIGIPAPLTAELTEQVRAEVDNFGIPTQRYTIVEI